ncbi:Brat protein [Aphelenchoides bicaudatus]|nr:Brat protein [Aphelenchoides bicaudatus]
MSIVLENLETVRERFNEPGGVAVTPDGNIAVVDTNNHRVQVFDGDGKFKFRFGEHGKRDGQLTYPSRVAVNMNNGCFVVAEKIQLKVFDNAGKFVRRFGQGVLDHLGGVAIDKKDRIAIVDCKLMRVLVFKWNGSVMSSFECNDLQYPNNICADDDEHVYICDNRLNCVKMFDYAGNFMRVIGATGITNFPISVMINSNGDVVVCDNYKAFNITVFDQMGNIKKCFKSLARHHQCFDTAILSDTSLIVCSKDNRVYVYHFVEAEVKLEDNHIDPQLSQYLYGIIKQDEELTLKSFILGGVTYDAVRRWTQHKSKRKFTDHTHRMLILYKSTSDNLPAEFSSVHAYSRVLERAFYSFKKDLSLLEDAKAGDGGTEDPQNATLVTQQHKDFVKKLLEETIKTPRYLTSNDNGDYCTCIKCGQKFPTRTIRIAHAKLCKGEKTEEVDNDNLIRVGTKRKAENLKKPTTQRALILWYKTVKKDTKWDDACTQWKQMPDDEKQPFKQQARDELDQYYANLAKSGQMNKKKCEKLGGEPPKPKTAYYLWLTDSKRTELKQANPEVKGNKINRLYGDAWKALTEAEKQPFEEQRKQNMKEYKSIMAELLNQQHSSDQEEQ